MPTSSRCAERSQREMEERRHIRFVRVIKRLVCDFILRLSIQFGIMCFDYKYRKRVSRDILLLRYVIIIRQHICTFLTGVELNKVASGLKVDLNRLPIVLLQRQYIFSSAGC